MSYSGNNKLENRIDDFDLHGIIGIRLIDAVQADVSAVTRQIGHMQTRLLRQPEITIRYVDKLPISSRVHYLGLNEVGYTDDAFLILKNGNKITVQYDQIGSHCEIVCETGTGSVPLLESILNLTALGKGLLPLHASAFIYQGHGIATTGWSRGGKTGMLLAFMSKGAHYVGDDWIYVDHDGNRMYGLPGLMQVREWYLREFPTFRARVDRNEQVRLQFTKTLRSITTMFLTVGARNGSFLKKTMRKVNKLVEQQERVDLQPIQLFGQDACALEGKLEKVFLVVNHEDPEIIVEPISPQEIASRISFALLNEWSDLTTNYIKFRFAFPELRNELVERIEEHQRLLLDQVLKDKQTYVVYHPYPVSAEALYHTVIPYCT